MAKKQKLELTWIGKDDEVRLEPRVLIENPELSYGNADTENMIIHGDNLLALKALEQDYTGKVKCIYIDPPYNTGNAFEHYDDGIEHSLWLNLINERLELLKELLAKDGSIWISIDDDESHYLKVLCDQIFGRQNFVANVIWEKKYSPQNDAKWLSDSHDHILVYAKDKQIWRPNLLPRTAEMDKRYKNMDNDSRGVWKSSDLSVKTYNKNTDYPITTPSGRIVNPPSGYCWRLSKERFQEYINDNRIWFGKSGENVPSIKRFLSEVKQGSVAKTIWMRVDVGDNQEAKKEVKLFNNKNVFATPKPEKLIERILKLSSNEGDLVLDSFLGSATTSAVAQKMNRKYIGIELGDHAITHCIPRMKMVVDGEQGGISKSATWQGGGGFKFYSLAPSLLRKDKFDNWIIEPSYNADLLASALAKQEAFTYHPDSELFWKQGHSTENDFIFTTTQFITVELIDRIHDEMGEDESLLVCAKTFQDACLSRYDNITLKKIPKVLLGKCEFAKDDYSLNITETEEVEADDEQ